MSANKSNYFAKKIVKALTKSARISLTYSTINTRSCISLWPCGT